MILLTLSTPVIHRDLKGRIVFFDPFSRCFRSLTGAGDNQGRIKPSRPSEPLGRRNRQDRPGGYRIFHIRLHCDIPPSATRVSKAALRQSSVRRRAPYRRRAKMPSPAPCGHCRSGGHRRSAIRWRGASPIRSLRARTSPENIRHDAGRHSPCIAALGLALDGKLDRDLFAKPTRNCRREGTKEKAPPKEGRDQHLGTRGTACLLVA